MAGGQKTQAKPDSEEGGQAAETPLEIRGKQLRSPFRSQEKKEQEKEVGSPSTPPLWNSNRWWSVTRAATQPT